MINSFQIYLPYAMAKMSLSFIDKGKPSVIFIQATGFLEMYIHFKENCDYIIRTFAILNNLSGENFPMALNVLKHEQMIAHLIY